MTARFHIYAVDKTPFDALMTKSLREVLATIAITLAEDERPMLFAYWCDDGLPSVTYHIYPPMRIRLAQGQGKAANARFLTQGELADAPRLQSTCGEFFASSNPMVHQWLLDVLSRSMNHRFVRSIADGKRPWWYHTVLAAASHWFGERSREYEDLAHLMKRSLDFGTEGDCHRTTWDAVETSFAVECFDRLKEHCVRYGVDGQDHISEPEWQTRVHEIVDQFMLIETFAFVEPNLLIYSN